MAKFKRTQTQEDIDSDNLYAVDGLMEHGRVNFSDEPMNGKPFSVLFEHLLISEQTYQDIVNYGIPRVCFHVGKQHPRWATDGDPKKMMIIEIQIDKE